jgi:hypothetical protein
MGIQTGMSIAEERHVTDQAGIPAPRQVPRKVPGRTH